MNEGIDFVFNWFGLLWGVIVSNWILAFGVLLSLLHLVVTLINGSTHQ